MTEALRIAPRALNGATTRVSAPPFSEIPYHLKKSTLKQIRRENGQVPETLWEERSIEVENRAANIIRSQTHIVSEVIINPKYTKGSDMKIKFIDGTEADAEIKSSSQGIQDFKSKVRNLFPELFPKEAASGQLFGPWVNEIIMSEWLTNNRLFLMNCSEYKSEEEILKYSFYPQYERMVAKERLSGNGFTQLFP